MLANRVLDSLVTPTVCISEPDGHFDPIYHYITLLHSISLELTVWLVTHITKQMVVIKSKMALKETLN